MSGGVSHQGARCSAREPGGRDLHEQGASLSCAQSEDCSSSASGGQRDEASPEYSARSRRVEASCHRHVPLDGCPVYVEHVIGITQDLRAELKSQISESTEADSSSNPTGSSPIGITSWPTQRRSSKSLESMLPSPRSTPLYLSRQVWSSRSRSSSQRASIQTKPIRWPRDRTRRSSQACTGEPPPALCKNRRSAHKRPVACIKNCCEATTLLILTIFSSTRASILKTRLFSSLTPSGQIGNICSPNSPRRSPTFNTSSLTSSRTPTSFNTTSCRSLRRTMALLSWEIQTRFDSQLSELCFLSLTRSCPLAGHLRLA